MNKKENFVLNNDFVYTLLDQLLSTGQQSPIFLGLRDLVGFYHLFNHTVTTAFINHLPAGISFEIGFFFDQVRFCHGEFPL